MFGFQSPQITIDVSKLKLSPVDAELAAVINEEVSNEREKLNIEARSRGMVNGLLGDSLGMYSSVPWEEILCGGSALQVVSDRTNVPKEIILERALSFQPQNWLAVFWNLQSEKANSNLYRYKLAAALKSGDIEKQIQMDREQVTKDFISERARQMALRKHQNSPIAEVQKAVVDCLRTNGHRYKNKAEFIRDMQEKYDDKVTSPRTIERWIAKSGEAPEHWPRRQKVG